MISWPRAGSPVDATLYCPHHPDFGHTLASAGSQLPECTGRPPFELGLDLARFLLRGRQGSRRHSGPRTWGASACSYGPVTGRMKPLDVPAGTAVVR